MNELHLFSGVGGGILGGILLGHTTVCAVEIEPYCRKVLLQRQRDGILPRFPIWDDVRTFDGKQWRGLVDCVCGGFPCQDISCAGKGKGLEGEWSGLWGEMRRIIGEVRPRYAFIENSPMLTTRGGVRVIADLAGMGFDARWGIIGADDVGSCHDRKRLWIVAFNANEIGCAGFDVQSKKFVPTTSPKREFERAIDATIPSMADSDMLRNHVDVAGWLDRYAAAGNGQNAVVVKLAWETLASGLTTHRDAAERDRRDGEETLKRGEL